MIDQDGMAVALTTTVNLVFGSMVLDPETGIILNDEVNSHCSAKNLLSTIRVRWTIFLFPERPTASVYGPRHVRRSISRLH